MTNWRRSKKRDSFLLKRRRRDVIEQLSEDLKTGFKRIDGKRSEEALEEKDKTRIKKELEILKQKI